MGGFILHAYKKGKAGKNSTHKEVKSQSQMQ